MDLNRLMRPLLPAVVVAFAAAGCTSSDDSDDTASGEDTQQQTEEDAASPLEGVTEPVELEIEPPAGFALDEELQRDVPMSEALNNYSFRLEGGDESAIIQVSAYVLDEAVDDSDYRGAVEYINAYDAEVGHEYEVENDRGTVAHGRAGIGMLTGFEQDGTALVQQNHYFFEASHAIQVTCQWSNADFTAVYDGCQSVLSSLPFPDGWTA